MTRKNEGPKHGAKVIQIDRARGKKKKPSRPDIFAWEPRASNNTPLARFWSDVSAWPVSRTVDGAAYVFLAEAIQELGQIIFPGVWTGTEKDAWPRFHLLPKEMDETKEARGFGNWESAKLFAHLALAENGKTAKGPELDPKEWQLAYDLAHAAWLEGFRKPYGRMAEVKRKIHAALASGELVAAVRAKAGGEMIRLAGSDWNFDHSFAQFRMCQLNFTVGDRTRHFLQREMEGRNFLWIFVTKESLDKFKMSVASQCAVNVATAARFKKWLLARMGPGSTVMKRDELAKQFESESPLNKLTQRMTKETFTAAVRDSGNLDWSKPGPRPRAIVG